MRKHLARPQPAHAPDAPAPASGPAAAHSSIKDARSGHRFSNISVLPADLRTGVEALSGIALDDVRVHYNSPHPAAVQALAYAQGTDIHLAPGQEAHLAHEAWHVVQQKQGRVQATMQAKGQPINDDGGLEAEADAMGRRAMEGQTAPAPITQHSVAANAPIQRVKWDTVTIPQADQDEAKRRREAQASAYQKVGMTNLLTKDTPEVESGSIANFLGSAREVPQSKPQDTVPWDTTNKWLPQANPVIDASKSLATPVKSTDLTHTAAKWKPTAPVAPKVGVSHRDGFGFDQYALNGTGVTPNNPSLNPTPLPITAPGRTQEEADLPNSNTRKWDLQRDRMAEVQNQRAVGGDLRANAIRDLNAVNGLYIPGDSTANPTQTDTDQQAPKNEAERLERDSRDPYEQALITEARKRGMPAMAICAGSWRMLEAYGGGVKTLPKDEQRTHSINQGIGSRSHGLHTEPNTFLRGTMPVPEGPDTKSHQADLEKVNSTHWAAALTDETGKLKPRQGRDGGSTNPDASKPRSKEVLETWDTVKDAVGKTPPSPATVSELMVSARSPDNNVEGFEARHGAPIMGLQWHPEAYQTGGARGKATPDAVAQSDALMKAFGQSMSAYGGKQQVNAALEQKAKIADSDERRQSAALLNKIKEG